MNWAKRGKAAGDRPSSRRSCREKGCTGPTGARPPAMHRADRGEAARDGPSSRRSRREARRESRSAGVLCPRVMSSRKTAGADGQAGSGMRVRGLR